MSTVTRILLVEDNTFDAKVFRRTLREAKVENPITVVSDGVEALTVLRTHPDIDNDDLVVVTDLNMPRINGIDLLEEIRGDAAFSHLPVFVITTSDAPTDREKAYELGVEGYILKTSDDSDQINSFIVYLKHHRNEL